MTAKEARLKLQKIVVQFAHIDLREMHRHAFMQIDIKTVRLIANENAKKTDSFISLIGDMVTNRLSVLSLFITADPKAIMTFTYRYLLMLRYLTSQPPGTSFVLSSDDDRFLEQTLIDLFYKVEDSVYHDVMSLHSEALGKGNPVPSEE